MNDDATPWLFSGRIEDAPLAMPATPPTRHRAGYVLAIELTGGRVRLASSDKPLRRLNEIANAMRNFESRSQILKVYLSPPLSLYETVKRWMGRQLAEHRVASDLFEVSADTVSRQLQTALELQQKSPQISTWISG